MRRKCLFVCLLDFAYFDLISLSLLSISLNLFTVYARTSTHAHGRRQAGRGSVIIILKSNIFPY